MTTVTFEAFAYLQKYQSIESVAAGRVLPMITETDKDEYFAEQGYPLIGTVTVTLTMHSPDKIVQGQIEALNAQLQKERADSQVRQNAILNQISKLSCLVHEVEA